MRHFILSVLYHHKSATQRLFHMLTILLVLVSNFGPLVTPAQAKAPEKSLASQAQTSTASSTNKRLEHLTPKIVNNDSPSTVASETNPIIWDVVCHNCHRTDYLDYDPDYPPAFEINTYWNHKVTVGGKTMLVTCSHQVVQYPNNVNPCPVNQTIYYFSFR
jgi:cytochrome c5